MTRVPDLPPEINDRIIDHLHDSPIALRQVSLACRSFAPCARLHLFHTIEVKNFRDLITIHTVLEHSPELVDAVRELIVSRVDIEHVLATALGRVPNLETLNIERASGNIPAAWKPKLARLCERLRSLRTMGFRFTCPPDIRLLFVSGRLENVHLGDVGSDGPVERAVYKHVDERSHISPLHDIMMGLVRNLAGSRAGYDLDFDMCTRRHGVWVSLRIVSIESSEIPERYHFTFDERTTADDARVAAGVPFDGRCGDLHIMTSCAEGSWLPKFFETVDAPRLTVLQLTCTSGLTAEWPWEAIDALLSDTERFPLLAQVQLRAARETGLLAATLPQFAARGGSFSVSLADFVYNAIAKGVLENLESRRYPAIVLMRAAMK